MSKPKQPERLRPPGLPREYVSVIDFGDMPRLRSFATLTEIVVDAVNVVYEDDALNPRFGEISVSAAREDPAKFVAAINQYFHDYDKTGNATMSIFHPDHGVIVAKDLATLVKAEAKKLELETWQAVVFSTEHITADDNTRLETDVLVHRQNKPPTSGLLVYGYVEGYFIYCSTDPESFEITVKDASAAGYSTALIELMRIAHRSGCKFVNLDADGPSFEEFPTFGW